MLSVSGLTEAQVSKDAFEKAVDLLNCKTVELTLPKENIQQYQQQCPCNETGFAQINQFLTSVGKLEATITLSNEVENLKKSFKDNWKKDDVITFLSESIFSDKTKYQKIYVFADKRKGKPEFATYKANLKTDLANKLVENVQQPNVTVPVKTVVQQPTLEDKVSSLEKENVTDNGKSWFSGITSQILVVSVLVSLLLSFLTLFLRSKLFDGDDNEVTDDIKNYVKRKIDDAGFSRNASGSNINSFELRDANNRIRDLELQVKNLTDKLSSATPIQSFTIQPTYQETKQPETKTETFFLSTPNSDGSFNDSSVSPTYKEGASIYRFTKAGNNRAKFQIDEREASVKLALTYPDKSIDPVCDAVNAFNPKAKRITTVETGEAELVNDKWIVNKTQKAKISYES